jgi:hypothetical protein
MNLPDKTPSKLSFFHRTAGGFYLTLWHWQVHVTLRRLPVVKTPDAPLPSEDPYGQDGE